MKTKKSLTSNDLNLRYLILGDLTIDMITQRVYQGEKDSLLKPREFSLLLYLIYHKGEVVSGDEIYKAIWN